MPYMLLLAPVFSFILLALHFFRNSFYLAAALCLVLPCLLAVRRLWAARLVQVCLCLGAIEWLRTVHVLVNIRIQAGEPVTRLVVILGSVAFTTLLSTAVFHTSRVKNWFNPDREAIDAAHEVGVEKNDN